MKNVFRLFFYLGFVLSLVFISSCGKDSPSNLSPDPCAGKTIDISLTPTASSGCSDNGSITAAATGSTGFTFKLNAGGTYQPGALFNNLAAGNYTVFAKDAAGCEKSATVTVSAGTAGPLFTLAKALIAAKCQSCHNNTIQNGGMNWAVDCNIVSNRGRIKVRAVDEGTMPVAGPLTTSEKAVITNWINAGGLYTN